MLTIKHIGGRACPFVYCDACGRRINRCAAGIVQIYSDGHMRFVHRGMCDDRSGDQGWYSLDAFLAYLLHNVRYDGARAKHQVDLLAEIG